MLTEAEILALRTKAIDAYFQQAYPDDVDWSVIFGRLVAARVLEDAATKLQTMVEPIRGFEVHARAVWVVDSCAVILREQANETSQEMSTDIGADISEED